ncbi:MAG: YifB family Mg chelatase-like AAA ATPase [Coriobacteriales bacterium]|nr:YifB family Mg chelatase-like AAA ATPase [Coriobacteriales bacterium]
MHTATISGVQALPVTVEVSVAYGMPGFFIIGMPDAAVSEARFRVKLACKAAGFQFPNMHVVVNLAPGSLKKAGSGFDLPIAIGILIATGQIDKHCSMNKLCVGELSVDGRVRGVSGQLAFEQLANEQGLHLLTAPTMRGVYGADKQRHECLESLSDLKKSQFLDACDQDNVSAQDCLDFRDVAGNDVTKRALQITAAGNHGLLMIGPPGSGKSMLASRLPTILPPLTEEQRIESALIHSVAGLPYNAILQGMKPFRAPHHSASRAGLLGGGTPPGPGEVSFAHNGVLFLDEMPEFGASVLQMLRQPIETGYVSLARARQTLRFPASFLLIAAANPCPCGYYGDKGHKCRCSEPQVANYQGRIGGPLLDRFDMVVRVNRSDPSQVLATGSGSSSAELRESVLAAHAFRRERELKCMQNTTGTNMPLNKHCDSIKEEAKVRALTQLTSSKDENNEQMTTQLSSSESAENLRLSAQFTALGDTAIKAKGAGQQLLESCRLNTTELDFLEKAARRYELSGRGIMRVLGVARTIADMEANYKVNSEHLLEAVSYRVENGGLS